jgi:DNA repair exonuclease SbcCD ATPase subunit
VDQSKGTEAGSGEGTSTPSNAQNAVNPLSDMQFTGPGTIIQTVSAVSEPTTRTPSADDTDVAMPDANQASTIVASAAPDQNATAQPPEDTVAAPHLVESFAMLMASFADQVSSTSILKYKREVAKQKRQRCVYTDERNRKSFKDYPVTIEQGIQARKLAEQELASVDQKLNDHIRAQNKLARTVAELFVSQIEQQKSTQEIHPERAVIFQKSLEMVEELSAHLATTLAETKQAKQNAAKSVKEAYDLVERATSTCKDAQQAAQKTFTQVNEVTVRVNELFAKVSGVQADAQQAIRKAAALDKDISEDHAQIVKLMDRVGDLEDDVKSLRERTADAEYEVKSLWDVKARSAALEDMRRDVNGDMAHLKKTQRDLASQVKSLEAVQKKCLQSYESLAPEVETNSKKIKELNLSPQTPGATDRTSLHENETPQRTALPTEHSASPAPGVQTNLETLQRSFQALSRQIEASATKSDLVTLRDAIASVQTEIGKVKDEFSTLLETYRKDAEIDREDLGALTKEVDELHTGQDQIRDTFTTHNDGIATRVDTVEKQAHDVAVEFREALDKAREEAETMARKINDVSKKVEATMTAATTTRPTPPSAPPTPQMHQPAHVPGRGPSSSPGTDNGALAVRLGELGRDFSRLSNFVSGQFSASPNLPATLSSFNQALLNLQSRYNNLTTEPLVRAMVQQMQLMYPYASNAQNEIRFVRSAISELEKLPPKLDQLTIQVDLHTKGIAKLEQKVSDHDKERTSSDDKQERLVAHVKEERDNLKQHVQEQHEKLRRHLEEQYGQLDKSILAVKEESVSGMAEVAAKVMKLEQVADRWATAKRPERLSRLSDKEVTPKATTQLEVNGPASARGSPQHLRASNQTPTGTPEESDWEALLKQFDGSARNRRVPPKLVVSDSDDSDTPLALNRTNSVTAASLNGHGPGAFGKRKRLLNASDEHEERKTLSETSGSPAKKKIPRRS